jgi:SNF2 family DNA or RNA helicase
VNYREVDHIKIPLSYKNQDELAQRISPYTMYLNSEEVLTLPTAMDITWEVEWTAGLRRVYDSMKKDMIAYWDKHVVVADNVLTQALRLHQLTGGYFADKDGGHFITTPKIDATLDILDEIGNHPTVVFTVFDSDVQALKPVLEKAGYKVKLLVGGTYQHEEFQAGDGDVILVNLSTGNAGIELTRARYVIYYSVGTSRTNYSQSRYRVRRPSSNIELPVTYYHLQLPYSVDTSLIKALRSKGDVAQALLDSLTNRIKG